MKKHIIFYCCIFILSICLCAYAIASFDESLIPNPIEEEQLNLFAKTKKSEYTLTGIRFDLDDENMPVVIVKQKQKNISDRSISVSSNLWIFDYNPNDLSGPELQSAGSHYKKDYLGSIIKNGKINKERKDELAPGEEYEFEYPYQIDDFSKPIYMYFITAENSINMKWLDETIVVIPDKGTVKQFK